MELRQKCVFAVRRRKLNDGGVNPKSTAKIYIHISDYNTLFRNPKTCKASEALKKGEYLQLSYFSQ